MSIAYYLVYVVAADILSTTLGSLAGLAALVLAINTVLLRREAKKQKSDEQRIDLIETSQTSMKAALERSDLENERLRSRITELETTRDEQAKQIRELRGEIFDLKRQLKDCLHGK